MGHHSSSLSGLGFTDEQTEAIKSNFEYGGFEDKKKKLVNLCRDINPVRLGQKGRRSKRCWILGCRNRRSYWSGRAACWIQQVLGFHADRIGMVKGNHHCMHQRPYQGFCHNNKLSGSSARIYSIHLVRFSSNRQVSSLAVAGELVRSVTCTIILLFYWNVRSKQRV